MTDIIEKGEIIVIIDEIGVNETARAEAAQEAAENAQEAAEAAQEAAEGVESAGAMRESNSAGYMVAAYRAASAARAAIASGLAMMQTYMTVAVSAALRAKKNAGQAHAVLSQMMSWAGYAAFMASRAKSQATSAAASAAKLQGTSTTSVTPGTGSKSFTTQASKSFDVGRDLLITSDADPTGTYMAGKATAYNSGTGALTVNVEKYAGSGAHTDWTIRVSGGVGVTGPAGTGDLQSTNNLSDLASYLTALTNLHIEGGTARGDAIYTILSTDKLVYTNAAMTAARAWTLPAANAVNAGRQIFIVDMYGGVTATNKITLTRAVADTINGGTTFDLDAAYGVVVLISDGSSKWSARLILPFGTSAGQAVRLDSAAKLPAVDGSQLLNVLLPNVAAALTAGFTSASVSAGTKSSGTYTFDPTVGGVQHCTNGGAFTFAPPSTHGAWIIDIVNNGSAGTITTSGWTIVDGDPFDTTNGHSWRCFISVGNQGSHLSRRRIV